MNVMLCFVLYWFIQMDEALEYEIDTIQTKQYNKNDNSNYQLPQQNLGQESPNNTRLKKLIKERGGHINIRNQQKSMTYTNESPQPKERNPQVQKYKTVKLNDKPIINASQNNNVASGIKEEQGNSFFRQSSTTYLSKQEKIEALKKKIGLTKQGNSGGKSDQTKKDGIVKIFIIKFKKWIKRNLKKCTKRKSQSKQKQKVNNVKRRTGVATNENLDKNNSGGEEGYVSSSGNTKRDSLQNSYISKATASSVSMVFSEQERIDKEIQQLKEAVKIMSKERMYQKAYRHLIDGLLYRSVRHDLDGEDNCWRRFIMFIWHIQNSSLWNDFLLFLGWVYILMSFFEPAHRNGQSLDQQTFHFMTGLESFILSLQTIDLIMEVLQRSSQENQNLLEAFISRKKNLFRLIFFVLNISDLINYVIQYPQNTFRFARVFRPLQIIIFSKSLRRNFQGIINSAKNLLMILFFDIIITSFWAYVGMNLIGDIYNDPSVDTSIVDFRDFFKASNSLYIFSSLDLFPDILFPAVTASFYYLLYFLPYIIMFLLLFVPIPVAVVYEGFRKHRLNLLIADRIKRRKALWACFQCIVQDQKKSYITKSEFCSFFYFVYQQVELEDQAEILSDVLYNEIDINDNKKVSIEEFFTVLEFTEQRKEFRLQRIKPSRLWINFREYIQFKFDLTNVLEGRKWEALSFLMTIGSCILTILILIYDSLSTDSYVDFFDKFFFAFFSLEIVLKIVAFGPVNFSDEPWNMFDLILVLFQAFFDYIFVTFLKNSNVKSVSASRVLKIAKLQKVFRMFRAFRTVKVLNYVLSGLDIIRKVYEMLYKIVICIPIVMKLSVIYVIVIYIYTAVGVEIFNTQLQTLYPSEYGRALCDQTDEGQTDFNSCQYVNFNSFAGASLILLQVCVGAGWGDIVFDFGKKFQDLATSALYFNSFHFLSVFVLSLIGGLVWEVFDVVERIMRDQEALEQQLAIYRKWEEQQQQIEASFQSQDLSKKSNTINQQQQQSLQQQSQFAKANQQRHSLKLSSGYLKMTPKFTVKLPSKQSQFEDDDEDEVIDETAQAEKSADKNLIILQKHSQNNNSVLQIESNGEGYEDDDIGTSEEISLSDSDDDSNQEEEDKNKSKEEAEIVRKALNEGPETMAGGTEMPIEEVINSCYQENDQEQKENPKFDQNHKSQKFFKQRYFSEELLAPDLVDALEQPQKNSLFFNSNHTSSQEIFKQDSKQNSIKIFSSKPSQTSITKIANFQQRLGKNIYNEDNPETQKLFQAISKKKKKQKKEKNKLKKNQEQAKAFNQQCLIENQPITQRDKSEIILYQDIFRLSTMDHFFKDINLKQKNQSPLSEIVSSEQQSEMSEKSPSLFRNQQLVEKTAQAPLPVGAVKKLSKFHTIKEEEEEEMDNNSQSIIKNFNRQQSKTNQGSQNEFSEDLENNKQQDQNSLNKIETPNSQQQAKDEKKFLFKKSHGKLSKQITDNSEQPTIQEEQEQDDEEVASAIYQMQLRGLPHSTNQNKKQIENRNQNEILDSVFEQTDENINNFDLLQKNQINRLSPVKLQNINLKNESSNQLKSKEGIIQNDQQQTQVQYIKLANETQKNSENHPKDQNEKQQCKGSIIFQQFEQNNFQQQQQLILNNNNQAKARSAQQLGNRVNEEAKNQFNHRHSDTINIQNLTKVIKDQVNFGDQKGFLISSDYSPNSQSDSSFDQSFKKQNKVNMKINNHFEGNLDEDESCSQNLTNKFPEKCYLPSKKIRESNCLLNQEEKPETEIILTQKMQEPSKKLHFGVDSTLDQEKNSIFPIPSTIDIFKSQKQMRQHNGSMQFSQYEDNFNTQLIQQNSLFSPQSMSLRKIEMDQLDKDQMRNMQITSQTNSKHLLILEEETTQEHKKTESNENHNFPLNNEHSDEIIQSRSKIITNDTQTNSKNSKTPIAVNIESETNFVTSLADEQNNLLNQEGYQKLSKKNNYKDINYSNFKREIEQNEQLSDDLNAESDLNQIEVKNHELEASFIQEMHDIDQENQSKEIRRNQRREMKLKIHLEKLEKYRNELCQYYKSSLQDITAQNDQQQYQFMNYGKTNILNKQQNPSQQQQNITNTAQRDIIHDRPKNYLMKSFLMNINNDLRNEQKAKVKIDLNNKNFIINKAILKSVDQEKIEKIELRHFRQLYGKEFEDLLDKEFFPLWHLQAKVLFHFDNILKYDHIPVENFVQLYCSLEMQISSLLMNKFSSFKIIYQDQDDKWFTINFVQEAYFLQEVESHGPWRYFKELFEDNPQNLKLFKHRNIFGYADKNQYIRKNLKKFFSISQDISNSYYFRKLQINQRRSDVIYIPFVNDNPEQTSKGLLDNLLKTPTLPQYIKRDDLSQEMIPQIKKGLVIAYLFDNPNVKQRKRTFVSEKINIEQAIAEEDILERELLSHTLNYSYSLELLKDMQKHIMMNKDMLFKKISQFYFYRACFERNFCSMMELPFEQ
ncbi:cation channel family transporter (macronuclear) [Tetrahymena thermophila SB210]|uniref:Cation channel family transporter n=1 Tax=Tetrahymena thermophila (strain SB210) TaxID=312017 RepID=Q22SA3_TETTS|nr:cation channel family transporter [Tetrahymena thermophila SB210]EAR87869.2 cation channel family transporter [Tetrahymena thermophila SB210]|eukprot:XP_001008114.2 cation channel family transporter [Tetrahymena thermophila SB210]